MIPFDPSGLLIGMLIMALSLCCWAGLLLYLIVLLHPRGRRYMGRRPKRFVFGGMLLAAGGLPIILMLHGMHKATQEQEEFDRLSRVQLEQPLQLGELVLPAGAQLRLDRVKPSQDEEGRERPYGLPSMEEATFAEPTLIRGIRTTHLSLPLTTPFLDEEGINTTGTLTLAGDQLIDGWPCSDTEEVEIGYFEAQRLRPSQWQVDACTLTPGSRVAGVEWPAGTRFRHIADDWNIDAHALPDKPLMRGGIAFSFLSMTLDEHQQAKRWQGTVAEPLVLGDTQYPSGASVTWLGDGRLLIVADPFAEAFLDVDKRRALEMYVLHGANGEVLGRFNQRDAEELERESIRSRRAASD